MRTKKLVAAIGIAAERKGQVFRAAIGRAGELSERAVETTEVWHAVRH